MAKIIEGTYDHKLLGKVVINKACLELQKKNLDKTSIFVEHDGGIKEVTKVLIKQFSK